MERTSMVKAGLLALAVLGISAYAHAQTRSVPDPIPLERDYLCFEGTTAGEVTRKANEAGARGWRLVAASPGNNGSIWCFEHLRAARPEAAR